MKPALTLLASLLLIAPLLSACDSRAEPVELLMFELENCPACKQFDKEVADRYARTDEARIAPLRRLPFESRPADISLKEDIKVSPTFVLVEQGKEVERFAGYTRDEQFWMSLRRVLNVLEARPHPRSPEE